MSLKIRQLPNLYLSDPFVSCFKALNQDCTVKGRIVRFLEKLNDSNDDDEYVMDLLAIGEMKKLKNSFYLFSSLYEGHYYLTLIQENRVLYLIKKETQEIAEEDWQEVENMLEQEDWE